ncbi:WhiB family transcriptional regulator [Streptosporangium sp. CA-135522]|uniref:WhiB family transcriptional regulator n=1 Tax=Streptosporangium sp. CA-135522 TaxID=3240072 RepID=UPI003D90F3F5
MTPRIWPPRQYDDVTDQAFDWRDFARCAEIDSETFFPEKGGSASDAKQICRSCEVRNECLASALANHERFGVWGGLSERERRPLLSATDCAEARGVGDVPALV